MTAGKEVFRIDLSGDFSPKSASKLVLVVFQSCPSRAGLPSNSESGVFSHTDEEFGDARWGHGVPHALRKK